MRSRNWPTSCKRTPSRPLFARLISLVSPSFFLPFFPRASSFFSSLAKKARGLLCFFSTRNIQTLCTFRTLFNSAYRSSLQPPRRFFFYNHRGKSDAFFFLLLETKNFLRLWPRRGTMITLVRPFLGPPFYPVSSLTPHEFPLRPAGIDSRGIFHADRPGRECAHENRSGECRDGGRERVRCRGDDGERGRVTSARARGGGEGRRAVGGRDRKTRVDCPCALGWLLERWHSDAYLRLPGVPLARSFGALFHHPWNLVSCRRKQLIGNSSPIFHVFPDCVSPDRRKNTFSKVTVLKLNFYS